MSERHTHLNVVGRWPEPGSGVPKTGLSPPSAKSLDSLNLPPDETGGQNRLYLIRASAAGVGRSPYGVGERLSARVSAHQWDSQPARQRITHVGTLRTGIRRAESKGDVVNQQNRSDGAVPPLRIKRHEKGLRGLGVRGLASPLTPAMAMQGAGEATGGPAHYRCKSRTDRSSSRREHPSGSPHPSPSPR